MLEQQCFKKKKQKKEGASANALCSGFLMRWCGWQIAAAAFSQRQEPVVGPTHRQTHMHRREREIGRKTKLGAGSLGGLGDHDTDG